MSIWTLLAATLESSGFEEEARTSLGEVRISFGRCNPDALIANIALGDKPNAVELATILRVRVPYLGMTKSGRGWCSLRETMLFEGNEESVDFPRPLSPPAAG